jgi:hypothetical protein
VPCPEGTGHRRGLLARTADDDDVVAPCRQLAGGGGADAVARARDHDRAAAVPPLVPRLIVPVVVRVVVLLVVPVVVVLGHGDLLGRAGIPVSIAALPGPPGGISARADSLRHA